LIEAIEKANTIMTTATHTHKLRGGCAGSRFGIPVRLLLAAFVALFLPTVASAQSANLWIDANGGTCTRQSTAAGYSDAAACASIQAAVSACVPGDTIRMKAGSYGSQTVTATKTSPGCTVIAEPTTTLTGQLTTSGAWYELQNITGSNAGWEASGSNITCRGCNFTGAQVDWGSATNISWIGGSLRNFSCVLCDHGMGISTVSSNLLIDGVTFDNIRGTGQAQGQHFEVIRIDGNINGLTIRKSKFTNNLTSTSTIFFSTWLGIKPKNITIENSFFGNSGDAYFHFNQNFQNQGTCENWTFRYNTFTGPQGLLAESGKCNGYTNVLWLGNLGPWSGYNACIGSAFRHNVWYGASGAGCSPTDTLTPSSGLGGADGFRLTAGAVAIDRGGSGADCIATDHDGKSRPVGARCDAGAHEYGAAAAAVSPPTNLTVR
jgi:hypothetical protein